MEKEILETFEAARKAGEAAAGGASPEVDRCVDALNRLRKIPVTTKELVATQVGRRILSLTKNPHQKIQTVASDLRQYWKDLVIQETTASIRKNNVSVDESPRGESQHERAVTSQVEKVQKPESMKIDKISTVSSRKNNVSEDKSPRVKSPRVEFQCERAVTSNVEKVQKPESMKIDEISRSESLKVEKISSGERVTIDKVSASESVKIEKSVNGETVGVDKTSVGGTLKVEKVEEAKHSSFIPKKQSSASMGPPKLTSMIKCNDETRDKFREIIFNALSKVSSEAPQDMMDEVATSDPIRVTVSVESLMFEKLGRSNGSQKAKYRSIMFNMRDEKNPDLRRRVLLGYVTPEELINMTPEEMASDERKKQNVQIKEKALFECERAGAPKATTDQFRCGRCGQRKTTYHQMQTRSADEPMTTFVTCVNCGNNWKFC